MDGCHAEFPGSHKFVQSPKVHDLAKAPILLVDGKVVGIELSQVVDWWDRLYGVFEKKGIRFILEHRQRVFVNEVGPRRMVDELNSVAHADD